MKKIIMVMVISVLLLISCGMKPTVLPSTETPTEKPTLTQTVTSSPTPTPTNSPTPSVDYKIFGLDFGPFTLPGQNPNKGTIIPVEQLKMQIAFIAPYTNWIRTYGCTGLEQVIPIAHDHGLKVAMGAWLSKDSSANEKEISCLIENANLYKPEMVIVGNETLYRKDLTSTQLLDYLNQVKTALPDTQVSTSDISSSWFDHPELFDGVDVVMANVYPYWEGEDVDHAITSIHLTYTKLQFLSGNKDIWIAETGWPDEGKIIDNAIPSQENAAFYFLNFVSWVKANQIKYLYFEAFDEPWKESLENPQEAHWGIWTADGMLKEGMEAVFNGETISDNWTPTETPTLAPTARIVATKIPVEPTPSGPASIYFSLPNGVTWPEKGWVKGYAKNVDPSQYKVAVFIKVGEGWWTKPLWDNPLTRISANGYWECPYITGGNDSEATEIVAFLVPNETNVPLAKGGGLPSFGDFPMAKITR